MSDEHPTRLSREQVVALLAHHRGFGAPEQATAVGAHRRAHVTRPQGSAHGQEVGLHVGHQAVRPGQEHGSQLPA